MNKLIRCFSSIAFFAYLVTAPACAAEPDVKLGMWKWKSTMEIVGMPFPVPPISYSDCLTKEDLIPKQPDDNQQCKMLDKKITSDSVEWKMECNGDAGKAVSEGKISYNGTSAKGEIKTSTQGMNMIVKLSGEHTGACK